MNYIINIQLQLTPALCEHQSYHTDAANVQDKRLAPPRIQT